MNRNNMNEYYAIHFADKVHDLLETVQVEVDTMREVLEDKGYKVSWHQVGDKKAKYTHCYVDSEHISIRAVATLSEGDNQVKLLGEYISLARAYNVIINQYEGEYKGE